jgi:hypothetical protein
MTNAESVKTFITSLVIAAAALLAACGSGEALDPEYQKVEGLNSSQSFSYADIAGAWKNVWGKGDLFLVRQSFYFLPDRSVLFETTVRDYSTSSPAVYVLYKGSASVSQTGLITTNLIKVKEVEPRAGNICAFCAQSIAPELKLVNNRLLITGPFDQFGLHGAFVPSKEPDAYAEKFRRAAANMKGTAPDLAADLEQMKADQLAAANATGQPEVAIASSGAGPAPKAPQPTCEEKLAEHQKQDDSQPYSSWSACQGQRYLIQSQSEYIHLVETYCPSGVPAPFRSIAVVREVLQSEQQTLPAVCKGQ